ncbi:unnamed protein product, partial [Choristocarpus tenellus]
MSVAPTKVPATEGVKTLRNLECIRSRCRAIHDAAKSDRLNHFRVNPSKLDTVATFVQNLMDKDYPSYEDVPYHSRWRHFEVGGLDRIKDLRVTWVCDKVEYARRMVDLVTTSVLLDAGAGDRWHYQEPGSGMELSRSEGLGVASFHMFAGGAFSSDSAFPHQADSAGLKLLGEEVLRKAFQVDDELNPLVGGQGRIQVLQRLGAAIEQHPEFFETGGVFRPGNMVDYLLAEADATTKEVSITKVWEVVMYGYEAMWPAGRTTLD